jgi:hypothetical protein
MMGYEVELLSAGTWKPLVRCQSLEEAARQIKSMGRYGVQSRIVLILPEGKTVLAEGSEIMKTVGPAPSAASRRS